MDTPKADKELRHRRNREPKVKHKTSYLAQIRYIEFMRSRAIRGLPLMWKTSGKAIGLTRYQQLRMDVMQRIMKL